MLRILDRHVLREFALHLLLGLSVFIGIYLIVDLFEKIDTFVDYHASTAAILTYYLNSLPVIFVQVLPIGMLLAGVLAFGQMRRFNEITAMQSCGLSPVRITAPVLALGLLVSGGSYLIGEFFVPGAYRQREETLEVTIKKKRPADSIGRSDVYYIGRGGRVYVAEQFDPRRPQLIGVSVQQLQAGPTLWKRADAAQALWSEEGFLELEHGSVRLFQEGRETMASFARYGDSRFVEQPDEFRRIENDPFRMTRGQLNDYIARIGEGGARVSKYRVDYHLRAAFPVANFIMVLLGTCLSLRIIRGTLALGFGISISLGFAYYGFLRVGQALGYTEHLHPMAAAWLGNIVFGILGAILFWRSNR